MAYFPVHLSIMRATRTCVCVCLPGVRKLITHRFVLPVLGQGSSSPRPFDSHASFKMQARVWPRWVLKQNVVPLHAEIGHTVVVRYMG